MYTMATILLVEDDPVQRSMFERILSILDHQVLLAHDGRSALQMVAQQLPDLILMDLELPYLNGYQVAIRLKADPTTRAIPILAMTASALPRNRKRALEAGCDEFMAKSIDINWLDSKIHQLLARS